MGIGNTITTEFISMRTFSVLLVVCLTVSCLQAQKQGKGGKGGNGGKGGSGGKKPAKGEEKMGGLCLSEEETMMICKAGTAFGDKAKAAMEACANGVATGRKGKGKGKGKGNGKGKGKGNGKGKGKGQGQKCPKFSEIMDWAEEEYADEMCIFTELGWLDNDMKVDEALINADIATLPNEIGEALNGEGYMKCYKNLMKKMKGMAPECDSKYSEEEMGHLGELADAIAHTECFKKTFMTSCAGYVKKTMMMNLMPAGK